MKVLSLIEQCAKRKAIRDLNAKERWEMEKRHKAVEMTSKLIAEIVVDANIRSELRGMQKKHSGNKR